MKQTAQYNIPINGIKSEIKNNTLIISSNRPLITLSSSILGGGFGRARHVLNHHVRKDFHHKTPEKYLEETALKLGIEENVVGMMTAADLKNLSLKTESTEDLMVCAVVTGGVSNAAAAGEDNTLGKIHAGTINTITIIDGNLTESAMVSTIITSTEAKTKALLELGVKSVSNSEAATGTTTDAVVVACTGKGAVLRYAGTATLLGVLVGKAIKNATKEAIIRQEGWKLQEKTRED